jgi:predicted kinase
MKMIILQGLPASGKSTYAKKLAYKDPHNTVIVNRDSIRASLGKYWVPSRERLVDDIEHLMIISALDRDYDVIIDAVNLNPKTLRKFEDYSKTYKATIEYKHFETPLWKCILRDFKRGLFGRKVGHKVIKGFYERYHGI